MFDPLPDEILLPVCVLLGAVYCFVGYMALRGDNSPQPEPSVQQ